MELKNQTLAYEILDLIDKNGGSMVYTDILNAFLPNVPPTKTDNTLCHMIDENLISGKIPSTSSITLTPKGEDELYAYRHNLSEEAAKVESSKQPPCNVNKRGNPLNSNHNNQLRMPISVKGVLNAVLKIGAFAAAVVAVYELIEIFFG